MAFPQSPILKVMQRFQISRIAVLCFLLVLVAIAAVPGYLTRNWSWAQPPQVANLKQLKNLGKEGVTLPGWQTKEKRKQRIGGHDWYFQELQQDDRKSIILLLLPQKSDKAQPEVEWMDINGSKTWLFTQNNYIDINRQRGWETDSYQQLQFAVESSQVKGRSPTSPPVKVEARFFRAWAFWTFYQEKTQPENLAKTFAVLQWYAWPGGGSPAPVHWFFADQKAQWSRRRVPWVAVSLHIPIKPLEDIENVRAQAQSLAQTVQAALMEGPLS